MKTFVLSTVILMLALLANVPLAAAQSGDEAAVAQAVENFRKAMVAGDRSAFESICADQLSFGHSGGTIETKAQFIDAALKRKAPWKFINHTDQTLKISGNSAIVRNIFIGENEGEGKTTAVKIGVLMVWQKQDGGWKLLARQAYRI